MYCTLWNLKIILIDNVFLKIIIIDNVFLKIIIIDNVFLKNTDFCSLFYLFLT